MLTPPPPTHPPPTTHHPPPVSGVGNVNVEIVPAVVVEHRWQSFHEDVHELLSARNILKTYVANNLFPDEVYIELDVFGAFW